MLPSESRRGRFSRSVPVAFRGVCRRSPNPVAVVPRLSPVDLSRNVHTTCSRYKSRAPPRIGVPAYDTTCELTGEYVVEFVRSAGDVSPVFERKTRRMFTEELGVNDVDADEWYDVEDCVRAHERVYEDVGAATMRQGGKEVGRAAIPESVDTIPEMIDTLNEAHEVSVRNAEEPEPIGVYRGELTDDRRARLAVTSAFPYRPAFVEGVFTGCVSLTVGTTPTVDAVDPTSDEKCAWAVAW